MTRSTRLLESLRELSDNLKGYAEDLRRDGAYRCCMGTYEHTAAKIDAIMREVEADLTGTASQPEPESADGEESPVTAQEDAGAVEA
ncbi:UNVERIFIED_CONTAM: hypothetical protein IGO34_24345, partial [Salmonella enterica subsp. enterica serovar Weltevreden]